VLSARGTPPHSWSAALKIFVLLVERGRVKAEWRPGWRVSGELCVTCPVGGGKKRQRMSADNLA